MTAHSSHSSLSEPTLHTFVDDERETKEEYDAAEPQSRVHEIAVIEAGNGVRSAEQESLDGGLVGWLQVLGSFFLAMNSWGIVNAFGVYQTFYETGFLGGVSPSTISWIGSIQAFLLLIVGVATGPIYDAGHFSALIRIGSFLIAFGIMMTSLSTEFWQAMLAQGVCIGLGSGCVFVPSVAILPQYFTRRKSFAIGIAVSGSSVGGVIYPIVFYKLQPQIGFAWATRVIGFIALTGLTVSVCVMRVRVLPQQKRALLEPKAFKELPYTFFTSGLFLAFIGLYAPIFYIQSYAISQNITNENLGFYMLPILNSASILGRILPNFFADRTGPLNMLIPCSLASGILCFGWIGINSVPSIIIFALLYGFFSGAFVSLPPSALVSLSPNMGVVGTRMGQCFAIAAFGILIGTPAAGAILNNTGKYLGTQVFAGSAVLLGVMSMFAARYTKFGAHLLVKA